MYITDNLASPVPKLAGQVCRARMECSMPLTPFLKEATFDPEAIKAMSAAFEGVCESLQLVNRSDALTEIVARKVIEVAGTGERDPERIRDLVLLALKETGERSA
jgi:hypothetical protein